MFLLMSFSVEKKMTRSEHYSYLFENASLTSKMKKLPISWNIVFQLYQKYAKHTHPNPALPSLPPCPHFPIQTFIAHKPGKKMSLAVSANPEG